MSIKCSQLNIAEIFDECQDIFISNNPTFFSLLDECIDLDEFIPLEFYDSFYLSLGRDRLYPLKGFLSALIVQKILSIPTDSLLISLLSLCRELRDFCGFTKVPDAPLFTRFKQDFALHLELMFSKMVDFTEPICQAIDPFLASITINDTSGIELYVKENNPKFLNGLIKQLKSYYKDSPNVDPYKMAYGIMPSQAASCSDAKQMYINGHFCYADKFSIITNGLGIVRHISFLDDDFKKNHPDIEIDKKSDSPDEDKSIGDSSALKAVLDDFFSLHPDFNPSIFLGDSAFDSIKTYTFLKEDFKFQKVLIPYNKRNESNLKKVGYNEYGYPLCPNDSSLVMKYRGLCREKGRSDRFKWICPKVHLQKGKWVCLCDNPCSSAKKGRTTYTYDNMSFRIFPGLQRDSDQWNSLYKIRTVIERVINHLKTNMCISGRKSRNHLTTKADVFIAGITSQITAIIAYKLSCPQLIRSLKPLIA